MEKDLGSDLINRELLSPSPQSLRKKNKRISLKFMVGLALCLFFGGIPLKGHAAECDLFSGQWVPDPSRPLYNNASCNFIMEYFNCMKNERPDSDYLHWRWKPYNCDLPPFDAKKFMNAMHDKSFAFIGDSIVRNQMVSLICYLSKVEEPVVVYRERYTALKVHFPIHNFTLSALWAPFLVKVELREQINIHLDVPDEKWTENYRNIDYVVIASGRWFLDTSTIMRENNKVIGCHNCGDDNLSELGSYDPYSKALQSAFDFIIAADHKPFVIFRTWSPDHFEYGEWYNGGICNRTAPYQEGQFNGKPYDHLMRDVEIEVFKKAAAVASKKGIHVELMDIYHLSMLRPDGHASRYRLFPPVDKNVEVQNDCLHWCLPGPIDNWNDIVMKILMDAGALNSSATHEQEAVI